MKNIRNIIETKYPPNKENIWLKGDRLYIYTAKGWVPIDTSFGDVRKKEYTDYDTLRFDKPTDGTVGVDTSTGKFYIYSNVTETWTAIDDKVIEGTYIADEDTFYTVDTDEEITGEEGKLYIDYSTGDIYRYHNNKWEKISSPHPETVFKVTWQELKNLRDNSELIAGSLYRITDYQCTTTQENTRSAGHQFDIILLALSENKLAEEGWATMNESNVYDVTFGDGVTKKCYLYNTHYGGQDAYNIVDINTLLGIPDADDYASIDEQNHTMNTGDIYNSTDLTDENLTYNYFQNSNLSAWKVWYCLDNDTDRFAWADIGGEIVQVAQLNLKVDNVNVVASRYTDGDFTKNDIQYYAWRYVDPTYGFNANRMTLTETPQPEDPIYINPYGTYTELSTGTIIISYVPPTLSQEGTGVIYRLIDEFNNDCPYDFKNIQYVRKLTDGVYDASGTNTWVYTLNLWDLSYNTCKDASIFGNIYMNDEDILGRVRNNVIVGGYTEWEHDNPGNALILNNNVILSIGENGDTIPYIFDNYLIDCANNTLTDANNNKYNRVFGSVVAGGINTIKDCDDSKISGIRLEILHCSGLDISASECQFINSTSITGNSLVYCEFNDCGAITINKDYVQRLKIFGNYNLIITSTQTTDFSHYLQNIVIYPNVNWDIEGISPKTISHNTLNDTFITEYKPVNSIVVNV